MKTKDQIAAFLRIKKRRWPLTALQRFENKYTKKENGCWEWVGARFPEGYGNFHLNGKNIGAHRASFMLKGVYIPRSKVVCHKCDNPPCVNPEHLYIGTRTDNACDAYERELKRPLSGTTNGRAKLSEKQVRDIRILINTLTHAKIAERYGISIGHVSNIVSRRIWKCVAECK